MLINPTEQFGPTDSRGRLVRSPMQLAQNVGDADRIIRGVAGIWLLAVAVSAVLEERSKIATITATAGLGLLGNAVSGVCGGNLLLGIDTTTDSACSRE